MQAGEAAGQSRSRNTAAVSRRMGRAAPADREESRVGGGVGCARAGGRGPHLGVVSLRDVQGQEQRWGRGAGGNGQVQRLQIGLGRGSGGGGAEAGGGRISKHPSSCAGL